MNATNKKIFSLSLLISLVFSLLCTGFYLYALLSSYQPSLDRFADSALVDIFLPLLYILAIVVFLLFGILFRQSLNGREQKVTLPHLFASGLAALTTTVFMISFAIDFFSQKGHGAIIRVFGILLLLFAIAAVAYFVLNTFPSPSRTALVLTGCGTILFFLFFAFYAYFDPALTLNSPIKIFDQTTVLALIFFFIAEIRFHFSTTREAIYLPIAMVALLFTASGSLSAIAYTFANGSSLYPLVMHDFLIFGLFLYVLTRMISFLLPAFAFKGKEEETMTNATFTAEEIASTLPSHASYAQQTFDFEQADGEDEEQSAPSSPKNTEENEEMDNGAEATLDIDRAKNGEQ